MVRKAFLVLRWVALGALVVCLLVVGTVAFLLKTGYGNGFVLRLAEDAFNRSFEGTLQIGRIDSIGLSKLKASNVVLLHQGHKILSVRRLQVDISPVALLAKRVWIPKLFLDGVLFDLARDEKGRPAVARAFRSRNPKPKGPPSEWKVRIARFEVIDGRFKDSELFMDQARIVGHFAFFGDAVRVDVSNLSSRLFFKKKEHAIQAALTYSYKERIHTLALLPSSVGFGRSFLRLHGNIRLAPAFHMELGLAFEHAFLPDFRHLFVLPGVSMAHPIEGGLGFFGDLQTFRVAWGLVSKASRVFGTLRGDLKGKEPELLVDIRELSLSSEEVRFHKDIAFALAGSGWLRVRGLSGLPKEGQADVHLTRASFRGVEVQDVHVRLNHSGDTLSIAASTKDSRGKASLEADVNLAAEGPFSASFSFDQVNPSAWKAGLPSGRLFGKGNVKGELAKAHGPRLTFDFDILPQSRVESMAGIKARAKGSWVPDRLGLEFASVTIGPNVFLLKGALDPKSLVYADLAFELNAKDLSALSSPLGMPLRGAMYSKGTLKKEEKQWLSKGKLSGEALRVRTYEIGKLDGSWDGLLQEGQPTGRFSASIEEMRAGVGFRTVRVLVTGARTLNVSLDATDTRLGGTYGLKTRVTPGKDAWRVMLDSFQIKAPKANWRLARPTELTVFSTGGVSVGRLELTDGGQAIFLEGAVGNEKSNLRLMLSGVQLNPLFSLLSPSFQGLAAEMNGRIELLGSRHAPVIRAKAAFKDVRLDKRTYGTLNVGMAYENNLATLDASWPSQKTRVIVQQPAGVSLARGVQVSLQKGRRLEARSDGLALGLLEPFVGSTLSSIAGVAQFQVVVAGGGTDEKSVNGSFAIQNGYVRVERLGTEAIFEEFQVHFLGTRARVSVKAHDVDGGRIALSGTFGLQGLQAEGLDLRLSAKMFSLARVPNYQIKADAVLALQGAMRSPSLSGEVIFRKSLLNPNLGLLSKKGIANDTTVYVHGKEEDAAQKTERSRTNAWLNPLSSLRMDVRLRITEDVLVRRTDVTANLRGNVQVRKEPEGPVKLEGSIEVARGWLNVYSKRFTIERAKATFTEATGLNPLLDIISVYTTSEYAVYVVVRGEAKMPQVEFKSMPELDKTDILSVLLFGKPQSGLGSTEQASFQSQAASASGGMIASTLLSEFREELGVSGLGFQIEEFSVTDDNGDGGRIGLGRYIGPKTYIRFYHSLNYQEGEEVAIDYHLTPKLGVSAHTTSQGTSGVDVFLHTQY
jgi:autotransporter translocation and assembly factor TamB